MAGQIYKGRYEKYQKKLFDKLGIQSNWKILDIGSGHAPSPIATVLADFNIEEVNDERGGNIVVKDKRPFFECSVEDMSCFKNNEFDFVICSHLLEHIKFPDKACSELVRVGKRGYIETPSRLNEILFGHKSHIWIIENWSGVLTFQRKTKQEKALSFGKYFYSLVDVTSRGYSKEYERLQETFFTILSNNPQFMYTMFFWKKRFKWLRI